jgi:hypothetical protein
VSAPRKHYVILSTAKSPCISLLFLLFLLPAPAQSQGCAQCRDSLAQTPARTQQAYRRAITLMVVAGAGVFTASVLLLRRFR